MDTRFTARQRSVPSRTLNIPPTTEAALQGPPVAPGEGRTGKSTEGAGHVAFESHLDACRQCNNHPFDLCPIGKALIAKVAEEL
jgi:hypothetical protein